jgi:tRNA dimethylallyltransferase
MAKLILSNFKTKKPLIVICGPTASGKTELSYLFYSAVKSEFISADSRQIYKYLDIGTAKPIRDELAKYPFHLIDFLEPDQYFSAGSFVQMAKEQIKKIYSINKLPIIVGGTGFYISALCDGLMVTEEDEIVDYFDIQELEQIKNLPRDELYLKLTEIDPNSAQKYTDKNPVRIIRALEYYFKTGERISEARCKKTIESDYKPIYFALDYPREDLYDRINLRCDKMIEDGLINEVEQILNLGFEPNLNSLNTVGYKEIMNYLQGNISLGFAISEMKKNTRRYAKRQLTWFRKNENINWLLPDTFSNFNIYELLKGYIL